MRVCVGPLLFACVMGFRTAATVSRLPLPPPPTHRARNLYVCADGEAAGRIVAGELRGRLSGESELLDAFGSSANQPSLTIRGPLYAVNRALSVLQYRSAKNWNGLVAVRVTVDDLGNSGAWWWLA